MLNPVLKRKYHVINWFTTTAGIDQLFSGETYDPYNEVQDIAVNECRASFYCIDIYVIGDGKVVLECLIFNTETEMINYLKDKR